MQNITDERLIYEILSVVEEIPKGKFASYGQIARFIGRKKNGCVDMKECQWDC